VVVGGGCCSDQVFGENGDVVLQLARLMMWCC
jgi:hypothetical protein